MFEFFTNKISDRVLILNVESDRVVGALIEINCEGVMKTISSVSKSIFLDSNATNSQRMTKKILKLAYDVVIHLMKESGHSKIKSIHYVLNTPWVISDLKTLNVKYDETKKITKALIDDLINNEIHNTKNSFDAYIFEKKILDIKLNGYAVDEYIGHSAHRIDISFSSSFSDKDFIENLKHTIERIVHIDSHVFHSALLTQYIALMNILQTDKEYIYINVHGELTDIILVKDKMCRHISSFPFGIKTILRKLSHKSKLTIESSDSMISLFQGGKLNEVENKKALNVIKPLIEDWQNNCIKSFLTAFDVIHLPNKVYLSAYTHRDLFINALKSQTQIRCEVVPYDDIVGDENIMLMNMYTHALSAVL